MSLSSTIGELSTKVLTTGSPGGTTYKISLTNSLDPLSDSSGDTVVSVKLTTPNGGDKTVSSIPVYMSVSSP